MLKQKSAFLCGQCYKVATKEFLCISITGRCDHIIKAENDFLVVHETMYSITHCFEIDN